MGLYAITFIILYPPVFAIVDEDAYLTQTMLFRSGHLSYDNSPVPAPHMTVNMAGKQVSKYPPGNSVFLLPFTFVGWQGVFLSGLLLALAGTWLFRLILAKLKPDADPVWSLLYLTYPAVVLFSRTVMSDLLAATMVLLAFYFLLLRNRYSFGAGLALGFACFVRYSNAVLVPILFLLVILYSRQKFRASLLFLIGLLPFAALIAGYNTYAFGGPFCFPMYLTGRFSWAYFPRDLWFYTKNLLLLYPLMLFSPLVVGKTRGLLLGLPAYAVFIAYSFFSYIHVVPSLAQRLTVGMRYLLPAVPFFILAWVIALDSFSRRTRPLSSLKYVIVGAMFVLSVCIQYRHQCYLKVQNHYRALLYKSVPKSALIVCNKDISELINYAWGWRDYREFAVFNAPVPLRRTIETRDTVYAGLLQKPGQTSFVELTVFESLLFLYPERQPVLTTQEPYILRIFLLKPIPLSDQTVGDSVGTAPPKRIPSRRKSRRR